MTTIFLSVTCYNVTMLTNNYYNDFFELGQQKINFSFFEFIKGICQKILLTYAFYKIII